MAEEGIIRPRELNSVQELLELSDIRGLDFHELSAKRNPDAPGPAAEGEDYSVQLDLSDMTTPTELNVRCRATLTLLSSTFIVDVSAAYEFSEPCVFSPELRQEFIERVGMMSVYPFIRQNFHAMSVQIGETPILLPILRANSVKLVHQDDVDEVHPPSIGTAIDAVD
ncbi:hypothetical protein [Arthrobacter humicola]